MKFWISRVSGSKSLSPNEERSIYYSSVFDPKISKQDIVFIVDEFNPTILYGWGKVANANIEKRYVQGDDEEANTPPYPTYYKIKIEIVYKEVFILPLSLSMYLSEKDFKKYHDEYENEYGGGVKEIPDRLVEKLKIFIGHIDSNIFLSYAKEDFKVAKKLYQSLTNSGFRVWFDDVSLLPGQNWKHEIQQAINKSKAFIALLSKNSISKRGYVQKELRLGFEALDLIPHSDIYLIPVRSEECTPEHPTLKDIHWVDIFPNYDSGIEKIISAIKKINAN